MKNKPLFITKLLIAGFMLCYLPAFSQITIQISDFPVAGEMVIKARDTSSLMTPGQGGMNQVWDFSHLVEHVTDTTLYAIPGSAWYGSSNHPGANLVAIEDNFDQSNPDFFNNNFYHTSAQGWMSKGSENLFSLFGIITAKMHLFYSGDAWVLPLPFTYGTSTSGSCRIDWYTAIFSMTTLTDSTHRISHCTFTRTGDGSGTIITPVGSYPAIRVYDLTNFADSVFKWNASTGWQFDKTETYSLTHYRFFAKNIGEVGSFTENSKKGKPDFTYFKSETLVGIANDIPLTEGGFYPNPTDGMVRLPGPAADNVKIYSLSGALVFEAGQVTELNLTTLARGAYIVRIIRGGNTTAHKLIKK